MEKETSCINTRAIIEYVQKHNNGDCAPLFGDLDPEIDRLTNPEAFFTDPNNWISCHVAGKLYERAAALFSDPMVAYRIAKFAVERKSFGYVQRIIVKAFWSTKKGLQNLQKLNDRWNRSKRVELVEIKNNEALIRLHWDPSMELSKHLCLMNQGIYTFMPLVWKGKPLLLEERCCFFDGAPYCEYHLKWPFRNKFHEVMSRFFTSKTVLMETIWEMEASKKIIEEKYEEVNKLNEKLGYRIRQLLAIQETGKAILAVLDLQRLLGVIMNTLSSACRIDRAMIMLINEDENCLEYIHGVGFDGPVPETVSKYQVPLGKVSNILARVASTGKAEYVPDVESSTLRRENIILTCGKPSSAYVVPLIARSKVIGVLATDGVDDTGISEETRETLDVFTPQIAIAIENARMYETLRQQMDEISRSHALLSRAEKFSFLGNLTAMLAHEIKNPLTAVSSYIQMVPDNYDNEEFRKDFYEIAMAETKRISRLITELLDLVKPREPCFQHIDLHELIEGTLLLISPQTRKKGISVISNLDRKIKKLFLDPDKIKQAILNILINAIDFTPLGGRIRIVTEHLAGPGNTACVRIRISDNGPGISPAIIEKIFDPYFTTKRHGTMRDGTGLGLFIAHRDLQEQGGTLEVESVENHGTTFILTVPYVLSPENGNAGERAKHAH
jgi:signal transduction histidine kinase